MANNNDYQDKFKGNLTGAMGKAFSTGARLSAKVATKGASLAVKGLLKVIKKIVTAVASTGVAFIVIIIVICSMLSALVIGTAIDMTSDTNVEQEAPELTKAYLNTYKDEFAEKIYELIQDERFNSYILNGEFDNAYTKLIYGGTNAYSQKELKGYAKADEADASWVKYTEDGKEINTKITGLNKLIVDINNNTNKKMKKILKEEIHKDNNSYGVDSYTIEDIYDIYDTRGKNKRNKALNIAEDDLNRANKKLKKLCDDGKYAKATPLLQRLQQYKDKGLSDDKILINDDYLRGYGKASGYSVDDNGEATDTGETMAFNKWINNSYYVIPYYYHVNMARNSEYKNKMGGTLTDSMKIYEHLFEILGADLIEDIGKACLGLTIASSVSSDMKYSTYKKVCDSFEKGCKNKKKRKSIAKEIINFYQKQDKIKKEATTKLGVGIYGVGVALKLNSVAELLKYIAENPELQIGLPNWNADSGNWQFMTYEKQPKTTIKNFSKDFSISPTIWNNQTYTMWYDSDLKAEKVQTYYDKYSKFNPQTFRQMSYKDILNTGFTKLYVKPSASLNNFPSISPSSGGKSKALYKKLQADSHNFHAYLGSKQRKFSGYPAQGVMLGYKQEAVTSSWNSGWNEFWGYDGLYDYSAFSNYAKTSFSGPMGPKSDFTNMQDDLYIYKWEKYNTKTGSNKSNRSNYYNYLRNVNDTKTVSKREDEKKKSINNELLVKLRNQFASYFINQIYYTYSDNIHDSEKNNTSTGGGSDYIRMKI